MIVKTFVDSNILIYAHDSDAGSKQRIAADRLAELWQSGTGLLSTQVIQKFYVNVTRKIGSPLPASVVRPVLHPQVARDYAAWIQSAVRAATVVLASEIGEADFVLGFTHDAPNCRRNRLRGRITMETLQKTA